MTTIQISNGAVIDDGSDWTSYKKWLDGTYASLPYTWALTGDWYSIIAFDGPAYRTAQIKRTDPPNADELDFEANYLAGRDKPIQPLAADGGPVVSQSAYAYSTDAARFVGYLYTVPSAGVFNFDEKLTSAVRLQGGTYWTTGGVLGDKVSLSVVDVDDILGKGAGYVVATYVMNAPVTPWQQLVALESPTAGLVPAGLYLRVTIDHTGAGGLSLGVTYRWYE